LLVDRSDFPGLEIGSDGFLLEVVDSDRKMIHFGCGLSFAQDQKVFTKHELVVTLSFAYFALEHTLIEIGRSLQVTDLQRNVIDTVTLEPRCLSRRGTAR